jgi:hypothetical protein
MDRRENPREEMNDRGIGPIQKHERKNINIRNGIRGRQFQIEEGAVLHKLFSKKNLAAINIPYMNFLCNSQVDRERDVTSTAIHLTVPGIADRRNRRNRAERLISRMIVHRPLTTVKFKLLQVAGEAPNYFVRANQLQESSEGSDAPYRLVMIDVLRS